jgi:ABC-type amino acid transport substrate-binding protein
MRETRKAESRVLRITAAVILTLFLGSCAPAPSLLERIIALGELRVVTRNSPTTFYFGADEPSGIEFELARGFAARLGVGLRMYPIDQFWELFPEVADGDAHIAAAGLNITRPRQAMVDFGPTYQSAQPQLIYRMGTKRPRSLAEVMGSRLEVVAGSGDARYRKFRIYIGRNGKPQTQSCSFDVSRTARPTTRSCHRTSSLSCVTTIQKLASHSNSAHHPRSRGRYREEQMD